MTIETAHIKIYIKTSLWKGRRFLSCMTLSLIFNHFQDFPFQFQKEGFLWQRCWRYRTTKICIKTKFISWPYGNSYYCFVPPVWLSWKPSINQPCLNIILDNLLYLEVKHLGPDHLLLLKEEVLCTCSRAKVFRTKYETQLEFPVGLERLIQKNKRTVGRDIWCYSGNQNTVDWIWPIQHYIRNIANAFFLVSRNLPHEGNPVFLQSDNFSVKMFIWGKIVIV